MTAADDRDEPDADDHRRPDRATPRTAADLVTGVALLGAAANVTMQLARPAVGHGVVESRVDRGNLFLHPMHRFRTTNTYLSVAMLGTDRDVRDYRRAVGRSHAQVHSTPDSPVAYHAFDRDLQLWVAACLLRGWEDVWALLHGRPGQRLPDPVYRECRTLGTALQVRDEQWPADRAAFEAYWTDALRHVAIDPVVHTYLWRLVRAEFLPRPFRALGPGAFFTAGFLPEPFRSMMGLSWDADDQRRFETIMRRLGAVLDRTPSAVRRLPYNALLTDLRIRRRCGLPLV